MGPESKPQPISSDMLSKKLHNAKNMKILMLDNLSVGTIDSKYAIDKLRAIHAINCSISKFSSFEIFTAAGPTLKKVNLSYNKLSDIPTAMADSCPNLEQLIFSHNSLLRMPNNLNQLAKLAELDLSNNQITEVSELPQNLKLVNLSNNRLRNIPE